MIRISSFFRNLPISNSSGGKLFLALTVLVFLTPFNNCIMKVDRDPSITPLDIGAQCIPSVDVMENLSLTANLSSNDSILLSGILRKIYLRDHENQESEEFFIETSDGSSFSLKFEQGTDLKSLKENFKTSVHARKLADGTYLVINEGNQPLVTSLLQEARPGEVKQNVVGAVVPKGVLTVMVRYKGNDTACDAGKYEGYHDKYHDFYDYASRGEVDISPNLSEVIGPFYTDTEFSTTLCTSFKWVNEVNDKIPAVYKEGSFSNYLKVIYVFNKSLCGSLGGWNLGKTNVIFGCTMPLNVILHELGHSFGGGHSGVPSSNCRARVYGDSSCTMGNTASTLFNAPQRARMGWVTPSKIKTLTPEGTETFRLLPLETDDSDIGSDYVGAKVRISSKDWYISYRTNKMPWTSGMSSSRRNKVHIHIKNDSTVSSSCTGSNTENMTIHAALSEGQEFSIPGTDYKVTVNKIVTDTYADVQVEFSEDIPDPVCDDKQHQIEWEKKASDVTKAVYDITVINPDSQECGPSVFDLNFTTAGFTHQFDTSSVSVDPLGSKRVKLTVDIPNDLPSGSYFFKVDIKNKNLSTETETISIPYTHTSDPPDEEDDLPVCPKGYVPLK